VIEVIRGVLAEKFPTRVIVDLNGLGLGLSVPFSTSKKIGEPGTTVSLLTHLYWREDGPQLFGFLTEPEREFFRLLNKVNKIGPKLALHIMSVAEIDQIVEMILTENTRGLTGLKGVGEKLASRLIVELKEPIAKLGFGAAPQNYEKKGLSKKLVFEKEAREALETLGYTGREIDKALQDVASQLPSDAPLQDLVEAALRNLSP